MESDVGDQGNNRPTDQDSRKASFRPTARSPNLPNFLSSIDEQSTDKLSCLRWTDCLQLVFTKSGVLQSVDRQTYTGRPTLVRLNQWSTEHYPAVERSAHISVS